MLGEKDVITPMKETHKFLKKVQFKDLTINQFPTGYHEMIQDEETEEIHRTIEEWLKVKEAEAIAFEFPNSIDLAPPLDVTEKRLKYLFLFLVVLFLWKKRPELFYSLYQILTFNKGK